MQQTAEVIAYGVFYSCAATHQEARPAISSSWKGYPVPDCGISGGHFCSKHDVVQDAIAKGC
jgi:hypothetical protein